MIQQIEKSSATISTTRRRIVTTALCWLTVAPGLIWAVIRLIGVDRGYLAQLLAFTPYVAAWTPLPLLLTLALRRWWPAGVAAVTTLALIAVVAPRVLPDQGSAAAGPTLRVLTANVLGGGADPDRVVDLVRIHGVDILALQEFTPSTQAALDRLGLATLLPHRQLNPEAHGAGGSALYSRFPLTESGSRRNTSAFGFSQTYATVLVPGAPPLLVESVHPGPPAELAAVDDWWNDLTAQQPATPDGPLRILAGDFNATLDHAPLRALLDTGYVDAAETTGDGLTGTWGPYDGDLIPPVTIDHILLDRRITVDEVSVHPTPGSDHRAVFAEVRIPG